MKKNNQRSPLSIIGGIFFIVIISLLGFFTASHAMGPSMGNSSFPSLFLSLILFLLFLYISILLQIIIHECGHLIFGLLTGYEFCSFRIGSFMLMKSPDGFHWKRFSLSGTGGQCLLIPPRMKDGQYPYVLYNLGGVIANTAASFFAFLGWLIIKNHYASLFLLSFLASGLFFALTNGIPLTLGGLDNDGKNALTLGKKDFNRKCMWIQLEINGLLSKGIRMKDMPPEWFFVPEADKLDNCLASTIGVYACNRAMDHMDFEQAAEIGNYLLEHAVLANIHRSALWAEMLFCELVGENRPDKVETFITPEFKQFTKATAAYPSTIRLLYAYALLARGDEEGAAQLSDRFEWAVKVYPYESEIEGERGLMRYIREVYRRRQRDEA